MTTPVVSHAAADPTSEKSGATIYSVGLPSAVAPSTREIVSLTGVRGVAALAVFIGHLIEFSAAHKNPALRALEWHGPSVDLFFVLSGFVLSHVYLKTAVPAPISWRRYSLARIARIFPLYYFACAFFAVAMAATYGWPDLVTYTKATHLLSQATLTSCWPIIGDGRQFLGPAWSVSVEMFCYAALFPLLAPCRISSAAIRTGLLAALVVAHYCLTYVGWNGDILFAPNHERMHFSPLALLTPALRGVLGFSTGWLIWQSWRAQDRMAALCARAAWPLIVGLVTIQLLRCVGLISFSWGPILIAPIIILCLASSGNVLSRLMSGRVSYFLGEISYSLYLLHVSVIYLLAPLAQRFSAAVWAFSCLVVVLGLSTLTYRFIEKPARDWMRERARSLRLGVIAPALR